MRYAFHSTDHCNMCGASSDHFKTLGKRLNQSQGGKVRRKVGITTTVQQCSECSLIFSNPMPVPDNIQDHYGVPPEAYWIDSYFQVDEHYFTGVINWLEGIRPMQPGMKALDIGAGIGKCMIALEGAGYDVYGIEPSIPFYERALSRMNLSEKKLSNVSIEDADFEENTFDFITFGAVLEHLYDPKDSIERAMKWLKPGGIVHIEVPSSKWLTNKLINRFYRLKGMDYVANLSPMHEPFHLYEFGLQSFKSLAKTGGFKVVDHQYIVCDTFLPSFLDFALKPYMKATNKGMQLAVLLQKEELKYEQHDNCVICGSVHLKDMEAYSEASLCKCLDCSFVFARKIPHLVQLEKFYKGDNYRRTNYLSPITVTRYQELFDNFEQFRKTNRILDVGAGSGFLLDIAKARGWEVYGTELTDDAVEYCQEKGIIMRKGSLEAVGFDPDMFDVITSIEVIEHLNNPNDLVREMHRIVRPGGKVYLTTPNFNSFLRRRLKAKFDVISFPEHLCYYTSTTLGRLFKSHGFMPETVRTTGISVTRLRTSKGTSNQDYVSETSDDEMIRYRIERNWSLKISKKIANTFLNIFKVGESLKGSFIKK